MFVTTRGSFRPESNTYARVLTVIRHDAHVCRSRYTTQHSPLLSHRTNMMRIPVFHPGTLRIAPIWETVPTLES